MAWKLAVDCEKAKQLTTLCWNNTVIGIDQNIDYYVTISFTTLYSGYHTSIQEKITAAQEAVPADRLRVYLTWLF